MSSQVIQQPSGAIIKLKDREHAMQFIEEKQRRYPSSRCIFWMNGDITIDLRSALGSYKGFFHNNLK